MATEVVDPTAASAVAIAPDAAIVVENLDIAYDSFVIQRDLNFTIRRGEIFVIMGGSGCGKSTVMRCLTGLKPPARGRVVIDGASFWEAAPARSASGSAATSASCIRAARSGAR